MELHSVKQRFGIIGNSPLLNRAITIACQVAPTDISVLITGESGSGKEAFSLIIHHLSHRKHGPFIAVNCGAIPEGTVDSELFGHVKGSFTSAVDDRKGYFEVVNGGTIFLDEVAELPFGTQARLLRILESGEYLRVGSSKVQKTNVRVIAATNVNIFEAVKKGKFREDLYYRLNTVPLRIPALKERKEDIYLLFRKFTTDYSEKYRSPVIRLTEDARISLSNYSWPGNVRQLKNVAEQISVLEKKRELNASILANYIPTDSHREALPALNKEHKTTDFSERDILYKVLFDMRRDLIDLKKLVAEIIQDPDTRNKTDHLPPHLVSKLYNDLLPYKDTYQTDIEQFNIQSPSSRNAVQPVIDEEVNYGPINEAEEIEESLSLNEQEADLIKKALKKYKGKRKHAAKELGISERTLYRKIKELSL